MSKARRPFGFQTGNILAAGLAALSAAGCTRAGESVCATGPAGSARANAASLSGLPWAPFGRPERGWRTYLALAAREVGSACPAASPGFAAALAKWQRSHGLAGVGIVDTATFARMKEIWQSRRPFVLASRRGCPPAPPLNTLAPAAPAESYGGKIVLLRPGALRAYRAMLAAARRTSPAVAADRRLLTIFSAFRAPAYDDARCALQQNCQGVTRAACSAHRTGLAVDLYLGAAAGFPPDSSNDANRLFLSRSAAYRWLVFNAGRFGFVNYPFEPWHWEWTGGPP